MARRNKPSSLAKRKCSASCVCFQESIGVFVDSGNCKTPCGRDALCRVRINGKLTAGGSFPTRPRRSAALPWRVVATILHVRPATVGRGLRPRRSRNSVEIALSSCMRSARSALPTKPTPNRQGCLDGRDALRRVRVGICRLQVTFHPTRPRQSAALPHLTNSRSPTWSSSQ